MILLSSENRSVHCSHSLVERQQKVSVRKESLVYRHSFARNVCPAYKFPIQNFQSGCDTGYTKTRDIHSPGDRRDFQWCVDSVKRMQLTVVKSCKSQVFSRTQRPDRSFHAEVLRNREQQSKPRNKATNTGEQNLATVGERWTLSKKDMRTRLSDTELG